MLEYYEPCLNVSPPEYLSTMGVIVTLTDPVDGELLRSAVEELRIRFPYFYVKAAWKGDDVITVPNDLPMTVRNTWEPITLNTEESNFHLAAWKYEHQRMAFEIPHVLTDGAGVLPYIKSVLFLYLSKATGRTFESAGFRLPGEAIPESETGDPFRHLDIDGVKAPLYRRDPVPEFFRLVRGEEVDKRVFYLKLSVEQVMTYCRKHDASPNVLFSLLLVKAARRYDPDDEKPVTVCVAADHKAMLGNNDSYRGLADNILLDFPNRINLNDITRTCTMIHGQLLLQAQPENSLWEMKHRKRNLPMPSLEIPQASICVSYPNLRSFGPLDPYIQECYFVTSLTKITDVLLEIACVNDSFFLSYMQPFASEKYLACFLEELRLAEISYELFGSEALRMCDVKLMSR